MLSRRNFFKGISVAIASLPLVNIMGKEGQAKEVFSLPRADDPLFWKKLRKQFMIPPDEVYFNNGTLGAQPRCVLESVTNHMHKCSVEIAHWDFTENSESLISGYSPYTELREKLARLINADTTEVSLTQNAHMGMNFMANGLILNPGDEVLATDQEHSGGRCGFELSVKRHGTKYKKVNIPVPINDPDEIVRLFEDAVTPQTRVIAIPHISTVPCVVFPIKRICELARKKGILSVIDGAQSVGQVKVDVRDLGCDVYYGSPHKWLLAPAGNGFLYVRKERADEVWTTLAGSNWDNREDPGYRLQQRGTGNPSLLKGLEAAIDFHNAIGSDRVIRRIKTLGDQLRAGLQQIPKVHFSSSLHPELCAGMTVYRIEGVKPKDMQDEFWKRAKMRPRALHEKMGIRHCVHVYNSFEEINTALDIVRDMASRA